MAEKPESEEFDDEEADEVAGGEDSLGVDRLMQDLDCLKIASDNAIKKKLVTKAQLHKIDEEVAAYIDAAAKAALSAPGPDVSELLTDVYSSAY